MTTPAIQAEDYVLTRNYLGSCRLTGQHYGFVRHNGCLLQPNIDSYLKEQISAGQPTAVADVACGNAIWTYDAAQHYPETQFYGIDISADQFPPKWVWPKNVDLSILNLFAEEFPTELHGKFDVINIRLVRGTAPNINMEKMDRALVNLLKLLKPGGFLQWEDNTYPFFFVFDPRSADPWTPRNGRDEPDFATHLTNSVGCFNAMWKDWDWANSMRLAGFDAVEATELPVVPSLLCHESAYWEWVLQEMYEAGKLKVDSEKAKILEQARFEREKVIGEGCLIHVIMSRFVGRKKAL